MPDEPVTNNPIPMEPSPENPGGAILSTVSKAPELLPQEVFDAALGNWLGTHVRGTPVTESAQAWAHLSAVLPELKGFLEIELAKVKGV